MCFQVLRRHGWAHVAVLFAAVLAGTGAAAQSDIGQAAGGGEPAIEPVASIVRMPTLPGHAGLGFGVSVLGSYDDNIAGSGMSGQYVSGWYTEIRPAIDLARTGTRSSLIVNYQPGFRMYSAVPGFNTVTHDVIGTASLALSRHWRLTGGGTLHYLPETAALFSTSQSAPTVDPIATLVTPASLPRNAVTTTSEFVQTQYQWSLRSFISVGATYSRQQFSSNQLLGTQGYSTRASYNYRFSPRITGAATYQFSQFSFAQGFGNSTHHAVLLGASFRQGSRVSLSASFGPSIGQFSQQSFVQLNPLLALLLGTQSLQFRSDRSQLGWTGTAQLAYNLQRTSVSLQYGRGANSGGGLYGSVESQSAGLGFQRKLSRTADLNANVNYVSTSFSNGVNLPYPDISHVALSVRYGRPVTRYTSMFVQYQHNRQMTSSSVLKTDRNVATIGFSFAKTNSSSSY